MIRPGRNDLCPCGSGRKYKRCCLGKESLREALSRELTSDALPLLRELGQYAVHRAGGTPETIAAAHFPFWQPPLDRVRASRLLDFLIFDYRPSKYGRSAAEEYLAERATIVAPRRRELLEAWQTRITCLFELEQWSGGFARCRPVLPSGGPAIEVIPLERIEERISDGAPIALRPLPVGGGSVYPSWPVTFGSRDAADVERAVTAKHHAFVRRERIVATEEFLRRQPTVFDEEAAGRASASIIIHARP